MTPSDLIVEGIRANYELAFDHLLNGQWQLARHETKDALAKIDLLAAPAADTDQPLLIDLADGPALINTPLQRGGDVPGAPETVSTVSTDPPSAPANYEPTPSRADHQNRRGKT